MTQTIAFAAAFVAGAAWQAAYAVDPDVGGPVRRGAAAVGNAAGAPGVENRIERREQVRDLRRADVNPNAAARANARATNDDWRMRRHNNEWWYYTPQNRWMYYRDKNWANYEANTYVAPRYSTGYRGLGGRGVYGPPTTAANRATTGTVNPAPVGAAASAPAAGEPAIAPPAVRATAPAPVPAPSP
jgi:hypothetical protein